MPESPRMPPSQYLNNTTPQRKGHDAMPQIRTIQRYVFEGHEYGSLRDVQYAVEDRIGAIIDTIGFLGPVPRVKISVVGVLITHREELARLLTTCYTDQDEPENAQTHPRSTPS